MKDFNEVSAFAGSGLNSGAESVGEKFPALLANWFDTALKGEPAFADLANVKVDAALATIAEKEDNSQVFASELTALNEDDAFDTKRIHDGIVSAFSMIARKAYQKGQQDAAMAIKQGVRSLDDF